MVPTITLLKDSGLVFSDTTMGLDQPIRVRMYAESAGSGITLFNLRIYGDDGMVSIDSGLNSHSFTHTLLIPKGPSSTERWVLRVRNKDFQWDSLSITIGLLPVESYGDIVTLENVELGAQNNPGPGSFFSLGLQKAFPLDSAFLFQDSMDLCYYYDSAGDLNTLASPGANIDASIYPGTHTLSAWSIRNEVRFVQTALTESEFLHCLNDSLILSNSFIYPVGKRKCKLLAPGQVYAFIRGERKGLILFRLVDGTDAGAIRMDIKMQQK